MGDTVYTFNKAAIERIARAVAKSEVDRAGRRFAPRRVTAGGAARLARTKVAIRNSSLYDAPIGAVYWSNTWDSTNLRYVCTRSDYAGSTRVMIGLTKINSGLYGFAFTEGICEVACDGYASISYLDRIAPQKDSFYAASCDIGPMLVVGSVPAAQQPAGFPEDAGLIRAILDRWRP